VFSVAKQQNKQQKDLHALCEANIEYIGLSSSTVPSQARFKIMFRFIAKKAVQQQRFAASRVMMSSTAAPPAVAAATPSVKDLLIDLTFVDPSGARRKAKGIIGE